MDLTLEQKKKVQDVCMSLLHYAPDISQIRLTYGHGDFIRFKTDKHKNGWLKVYYWRGELTLSCRDWAKDMPECRWSDTDGKISSPLTSEQRQEYENAVREADEREKKAIAAFEPYFLSLPQIDGTIEERGVTHPYLESKGLMYSRVGRWDNSSRELIFPMYNRSYEVKGLQRIFWNRYEEKFSKGYAEFTHPIGLFCALFPEGKYRLDLMYAVEGMATGLSVYEATGRMVIVTYMAGNLREGIKSAAAWLSNTKCHRTTAAELARRFVIVADNDISQTGENAAALASKALGCRYVLIPETGMDANDYMQKYGSAKLQEFLK